MKKYLKAEITSISIMQNVRVASVSFEDYLTANGRVPTDIKDAENYGTGAGAPSVDDGFSQAS